MTKIDIYYLLTVGTLVAFIIGFYSSIAYVAWHFISKFW
jgi:hypothetical protein